MAGARPGHAIADIPSEVLLSQRRRLFSRAQAGANGFTVGESRPEIGEVGQLIPPTARVRSTLKGSSTTPDSGRSE